MYVVHSVVLQLWLHIYVPEVYNNIALILLNYNLKDWHIAKKNFLATALRQSSRKDRNVQKAHWVWKVTKRSFWGKNPCWQILSIFFSQVTDGRMTDSLSKPFSVLKSKKSVKCRRSNELLQIAVVEFIYTWLWKALLRKQVEKKALTFTVTWATERLAIYSFFISRTCLIKTFFDKKTS